MSPETVDKDTPQLQAPGEMVLRGTKSKFKTAIKKDKAQRPSSKMAAAVSSQSHSPHKAKPLKLTANTTEATEDSDSDSGDSQMESHSVLFEKFEHILQKALKQTSDHITDKLTREIRELGFRTADLEIRMDDIESQSQHFTSEFKNLKEENVILQSRLEDQENRARRANLRIRGIPETITDVYATMIALFQELHPGIPVERLEMDRAHRALAPRKPNGPPRDIIVKFHYYRTKEQLLAAAREKGPLMFQGHVYQLFSDLSPITVAKRRALKPQLLLLQQHQINYQWGFPFSLRFTHLETKYICRSSEDLQSALIELGLADKTTSKDHSRRRSASKSPQHSATANSKSPSSSSPQNQHKRGRFEHLTPNTEDSMD